MKDSPRSSLEELLERRLLGPFVPLRRDWKQRVLKKALAHLRSKPERRG